MHAASHVKETLLLGTGSSGSAIPRSSGLVDLRSRNTGDALTRFGAVRNPVSLETKSLGKHVQLFCLHMKLKAEIVSFVFNSEALVVF